VFFQVHGRRSSKGVQTYGKVRSRNVVRWSVLFTSSTRSHGNHLPEVLQRLLLCVASEACSQVDVIMTIWSSGTVYVHLYVASLHALEFLFRVPAMLDRCSLRTAQTRGLLVRGSKPNTACSLPSLTFYRMSSKSSRWIVADDIPTPPTLQIHLTATARFTTCPSLPTA
jgi:hypothetical protein